MVTCCCARAQCPSCTDDTHLIYKHRGMHSLHRGFFSKGNRSASHERSTHFVAHLKFSANVTLEQPVIEEKLLPRPTCLQSRWAIPRSLHPTTKDHLSPLRLPDSLGHLLGIDSNRMVGNEHGYPGGRTLRWTWSAGEKNGRRRRGCPSSF